MNVRLHGYRVHCFLRTMNYLWIVTKSTEGLQQWLSISCQYVHADLTACRANHLILTKTLLCTCTLMV